MKEIFYYRMSSYDMIETTISISPDICCSVPFCIPDQKRVACSFSNSLFWYCLFRVILTLFFRSL